MVSPRGPAKSFSTLNNSPLQREKKTNTKTVPFPQSSCGFPESVLESTYREANEKFLCLGMVWGSDFCPCEGAEPGVNFTTFIVLSRHKKSDEVIEKGEGDTS